MHIEKEKIGIFDSGVGGLTVVKELMALLPNKPLIYFGDTARTPYGTKSAETIIQYAIEDTEFLIKHGATVIVIACHSVASVATETLKKRFTLPIFEVISPSRELAIKSTKNKNIGLIGTRATVNSGVYNREIAQTSPDIKLFSQPCPLLVPLVEEGWLKSRETRMIIRKYLRPLRNMSIDTLILGCTHYPLLKRVISEIAGKKISIIDPSKEVARDVFEHLKNNGIDNSDLENIHESQSRFYLSDVSPATEKIATNFLGRKIIVEKAAV